MNKCVTLCEPVDTKWACLIYTTERSTSDLSTSFLLHWSPMDFLLSSIESGTLFSLSLLRERLMLFKGLTKKQSPLIENLKKKEYIKSTPFNTEPRTPLF